MDRVGDEVQQPRPRSRQRSGEHRLGLGDDHQRPLPGLLEGAGRGDPFAQLLGLPAPLSACRSMPASPCTRSRARMNGSVTVPSSRSVPRGLPVRSTGPETSSTSSSSWKASPIAGRTHPARRPAARALARRQRPQPAGRLEQGRGLQLAARAGSARPRRPRARRLRAAAARLRPAPSWRPRARCSCADVAVAGELGEGAREQQVAGRDRRSAPGRGGHRGLPAAQRGAVDHIVVHQRRGVHQLDRHGRAHEPPRRPASPARLRPPRRRASPAAGAGACRPRSRSRWRGPPVAHRPPR